MKAKPVVPCKAKRFPYPLFYMEQANRIDEWRMPASKRALPT